MAVVMIEGFDHLAAGDFTAKGWTIGFTSVETGRLGGKCARFNSGNTLSTVKALPATYATVIIGFAFRRNATPTASRMFAQLRQANGSTVICQIGLDATGHLIIRDSAGTLLATGAAVMNVATWYYVEVKAYVNGASGTVEGHLNGAADIAQATVNIGSTNFGSVYLGCPDNNHGFSNGWDYDDLYVADTSGAAPRNAYLGDVRVETIYPTADGTNTAWAASTSTDVSCVDDATPNGDTDYISDATAGHLESFGTGDLTASAGTVYGVQTNLWARKDDAAGTARTIAPLIRQGGTDYAGTTVALATTYADLTQIYNQDPTNSDWTISNVNADEYGVKLVA